MPDMRLLHLETVRARVVRKREGRRITSRRVFNSSGLLWGMARSLLAQTLGSAVVPGSFVLAQAAQRLLDAYPSSATAWYLNLAVFAPLQDVRGVPSLLATVLDRTSATEFALILLLMAAVQIVRFRLGVALFAHLAFAASLLVARAWTADLHGAMSPWVLQTREAGGTALVALLLAATGLACAVSHASFILAIVKCEGDMPHFAWPRRASVPADRPMLSPATRLSL